MFDKKVFDVAFKRSVKALTGAEKVTRSELLTLSRSVLEALHATGDIAYVNNVIKVLTPVNRKVAVLYFKAFSGFSYSEEEMQFSKKDKKNYDAAVLKCIDFLDDPLNNIWSWAERNIDVEPKAFDINASMGIVMKKALKNNLSHMDILKAVLANGISTDDLIELMSTLDDVEINVA
jgi:hypothetical protein